MTPLISAWLDDGDGGGGGGGNLKDVQLNYPNEVRPDLFELRSYAL